MNAWLKGLGMAALGGTLMGVNSAMQHRLQNGKDAPPVNGAVVGFNALLGALLAAAAYITSSPGSGQDQGQNQR
jgi:drug/metabolite transporter (DMT)-like permease